MINISKDKISKNKEACFEKLRVIFLQDLLTKLVSECVINRYVELRSLETDFTD